MTLMAAPDLSGVPGLQTMAADVQDALASGHNAVVVTACVNRATAVEERVGGWLFSRGFVYAEAEVPFSGDGCSELAAAFGVAPNRSALTLDAVLALAADAGTQSVLLRSHLAGDAGKWRTTCDSIQRWARLHRSSAKAVPAFCAVLVSPPREAIPSEDANLRVFWGHRIESAIDVRTWCRTTPDSVDPLQTSYRDHVLPSLSGSDVGLAVQLWPRIYDDPDPSIVEACADYGTSRGWTGPAIRAAVNSLNVFKGPGPGLVPTQMSPACERLWLLGYIQWSPEYGAELHAAAQALLGRPHQIGRRVWRGQITLAFPLINHLRASVCDYLTTAYGNEWPNWTPILEPAEREALKESPRNCQLGHLCRLLDQRRRRGDRLMGQLYCLSIALRDMRNELAHYRPIAFSELVDLRRLAAESGAWSDDIGC
jgi:hypothetical protein